MTRRRAVFVDRDGVINELVDDPVTGRPESPLAPDRVALVPGAAAALRSLAAEGWTLVGVSNQPAAAKGRLSITELEAVQAAVLAQLAAADVTFADFRLCLHHPDGRVPQLSGPCDCRKPAPGMLLAAAGELEIDLAASWMVGDTDADVLAGAAVGCATVMVENPASAHKRLGGCTPTTRAEDLVGAGEAIRRRSPVQ